MKISYNWLNEYLLLNKSYLEVATLLTDIGLEVENIERFESIKGGLKGVVIGEIISKKPHPNADRLNLTYVNIGEEECLQIVCGAPNVDVGQKVLVATVGTFLYTDNDRFKIKRSKIRGEFSIGMICSEKELGLGKDDEGIMVLDSDSKVGEKASDYFNIEIDFIFDIGLTPNRSDAMGHLGVARDLKAVLNHQGSNLDICRAVVDEFKVVKSEKNIIIDINDHSLCPRYSGVSISNIKIKESPKWLQDRLQSIGLQPINNIVDITNYVLHETGQPLHAFDMCKIEGNKILVSTLKEPSKLVTLDNIQRELDSNDLIISDEKKPLCIAGVFGGIESAVNDQTIDVFLESAYFDSTVIRATAKRHNLNTDSSFRFERGCDPNMTIYALKRAALLITEICGGYVSSEIIDVYPKKIEHFKVDLSFEYMDNLIGKVIDRKMITSILSDLEIDVVKSDNNGLSLLVPPFRTDVQREVDVIEEVLRIYGFNNISISNKLNTVFPNKDLLDNETIRNSISELLSSNGFYEVINNSLINSEHVSLIDDFDIKNNVSLLNSISTNLNSMRQSLLFGGLENIAYNQNRKNTKLKLYEFGKTYHKLLNEYKEYQHLQLLVTGIVKFDNWNVISESVDFYFLKERVEHILSVLGISQFESVEGSGFGMTYSLTYESKGLSLVSFGKVDDEICNNFGVKSDVYMADFNWDLIVDLSHSNNKKYKSENKFPEVRRDLSLLIDNKITFKELKDLSFSVENKILKGVNLFDVYESNDKLPDGKKSYALSFVFGDRTRTLTDKDVDQIMKKLINIFSKEVGAEIR